MNDTFSVSLSTPLGRQTGTIHLESDGGGALSGWVDALGRRNPIADGKADGNRFEFSGQFRAPFGTIPYRATGSVAEDTLEADVSTPFGNFHITGSRVS